jgi:hypothetical protein
MYAALPRSYCSVPESKTYAGYRRQPQLSIQCDLYTAFGSTTRAFMKISKMRWHRLVSPARGWPQMSKRPNNLFNVTSLPIPVYTGVEARIYAIVKGVHTLPGNHLPIMMEIEDIHGKRHSPQASASRIERLISGRNVAS